MAQQDWTVDEDLRRHVVAQLSAVAHMAAYTALIHRKLAQLWDSMPPGPVLHVAGEFSARRMDILGDLLNNMDVWCEDDDWLTPIFAEAQRRWPRTDLENEQLRRDASRYRWLRSRDVETIHQGGVFAGVTPDNLVINGEDLDRRVDEAMASSATAEGRTE